MKKILIVLLAMVFLNGCLGYWIKGGGTQEQFNKDKCDCEKKAQMSSRSHHELSSLFKNCMEAKGYTWIKPVVKNYFTMETTGIEKAKFKTNR